VEIDADVGVLARGFLQLRKRDDRLLDELLVRDDAGLRGVFDPGLECGEILLFPLLEPRQVVGDVGVDAHLVARGAAEQLVDGHAEQLALDVPEGLLDAAQHAREDGSAAVERVPVNRLPVVHHVPRILADEVGLHLGDGRCAGLGAALENGVAGADDAGVGVHLEEQPARLHENGFEFRDAQLRREIRRPALHAPCGGAVDGRRRAIGRGERGAEAGGREDAEDVLQKIPAEDGSRSGGGFFHGEQAGRAARGERKLRS
jgi:hypothetical protein